MHRSVAALRIAGFLGWMLVFVIPCNAAEEMRDPRPQLSREEVVEAIKTPDSTKAYAAVLKVWGDGYQSVAEAMLEKLVKAHPNNTRLAFFHAACVRSRFQVKEGATLFAELADRDPKSVEGRFAKLLVFIDLKRDLEPTLASFRELLKKHPEDPLYLWMAAVMCRTLNNNEEGIGYYERLLKQVTVGPVLVHQTYANLLDQVRQYEKSLKHRHLAVQLEPASWSWHALGNTLYSLKRYEPAAEAYVKAVELAPDEVRYMSRCADCLARAGKFKEAAAMARRTVELDEKEAWGWSMWAWSLCELGDFEGAREKLARAESLIDHPFYAPLKAYITRCEKGGPRGTAPWIVRPKGY